MNKISKETLDTIKRAIEIAESNEIEILLFADKKIRGQSVENGIFILQELDKEFEFPPLALSRLDTLKKRMTLVENIADYEAFYETDVNGTKVHKLLLKNKRTKIEFRCAAQDTIRSPLKVNDPISFSFEMDKETVDVLNRIASSMGVETVTFCGTNTDNKLIIKVKDSSGDSLEHITDSAISWLNEGTEFNFVYAVKKIARLIRDAVSFNRNNVQLTKKGLMITSSKGITVYTVPEV